jgi:hypothetical protein
MENKVELLGYYGSDEIIACSAWTSTSRNLTDEKRARVQRIASHIHLLKHRVSSLNAESARYKE